MYTSAISGSGDVNSAAWNAIASIKSTSPFADGSSSSDDVAGEFDSLINTSATDSLSGASASTDDTSSSTSLSDLASTGSASSSQLAMLREIQNAEQSTVSLYA